MLELKVAKRLGELSLEAELVCPGSGVTALFGVSGAGKTSLVNMVAGLLRPDQGRVALEGRVLYDSQQGVDLPPERRRVGYVFQEARLFPHYSVLGNLRYGARLAPAGQAWADLDQVVELLGLGKLLGRRPARLSGGEKQRVAIGRALMASPRILLMDEPLASLDSARKNEVLPFLSRLSERLAVPMLYVSHHPGEILQLADRVAVVEAGRMVALESPEEFRQRLTARPAWEVLEGR